MSRATMNVANSESNPQRRRRRFSWKYDEDHHIGQYSDENTLLPINEDYYQSEDDQENSYEYSYDCNEYDDSETDQETGMDFCESGVSNGHTSQQNQQQSSNLQNNEFGNGTGRRRRRSLRKVLGKGWEVPPSHVMRRRILFRQNVDDETRRHRRILPNTTSRNKDRAGVDGTNSTAGPSIEERPKHILHLLRDREVFGGGSNNGGLRSLTGRGMGSSNAGRSGFRIGVPIVSAKRECDEDTEHKRRRRQKKRHRNQAAASSGMEAPDKKPSSPSSVASFEGGGRKTATATNHLLYSRSHRPIADQLRTYSEQACVTKFESSYLSHLQHDVVEDPPPEAASNEPAGGPSESNNNNSNNSNGTSNTSNRSGGSSSRSNAHQVIPPQQANNNSSKAVSTISIAFAPDGKTMASTHGDHTVKITCCITGKLLQTLVGHPRTPWTVKYHPHAGADHRNPNTKRVIIANRTATSSTNNSTGSQEDISQQQQEQKRQQQIVASGCLGHQVRIWDWISGTCLQMIRLEFAIISLSFHPSGSVLAIANGTRLHFWGLPTVTQTEEEIPSGETTTATNSTIEGGSNTGEAGGNDSATNNSSTITNNSGSRIRTITNPSRGMHIEMRHMLRCVHFLPDGKKVIVGGVNPQTQAEIRRQRQLAAEGNQEKVPTMSFYLRLWDFDLDAAKGPSSLSESARHQGTEGAQASRGGAPQNAVSVERSASSSSVSNDSNSNSSGRPTRQQAILQSTQAAAAAAALGTTTRRRRAISNPRCFVPRALLYNDGGFDVSPDGKTLCACAEYWLPEGVDNATDLLHPPEKDDDDVDFDYDSSSDDSSSDEEDESHSSDNNEKDVKMSDVSSEETDKKQTSPMQTLRKVDEDTSVAAGSTGGIPSADTDESNPPSEKASEDSNHEARNPSAPVADVSPTRPRSSSTSHPSATPPRILGRQPHQISSPPLAMGAIAGTTASGYGLPMPPIQAGITPQTPPPNVNPLNFPLSPPSPPGRRFAGGLNRGTQPLSQQHDQLLQQYNRQQAMLNQQRQNPHQQQNMPPPQQQRGGSYSTPPSRGTENTSTTIPAPPGINHRNHRQHRMQTQQSSGSSVHKPGNPFATTSRNSRGGTNSTTPRGRFVPHVVTISLDTEPYVETTTEEVVVGSAGPNLVSGDVVVVESAHQQSGSSRIRTTTVASTSNAGGNSTTTTVTKTTYNVPGRGAAFGATRPHVLERRPRLGQLLSACPLDGAKASAVTCVKFSPYTDFCLIGYGVREPHVEEANGDSNEAPAHPPYHPVTAMYKVNKGGTMRHVSTMLSGDDDVNIARFHPNSGYGFVYGTKQGRIRILGPRPWNYYNC